MKILYRSVAWAVGVLAVIALLYGWVSAKRVFLVAQENLVVESYPIPDSTRFPKVGKIGAGEKIQVLSCDDLKHYIAIHVRLKDGQEGYVLGGKFTLESFPFWSSMDSPVSYSCPPAGY